MKNTTAEAAYIEAYRRTMEAMEALKTMIHDNPAPEGEVKINWAHVGDMLRIATALEEILPEK